MSPDAIIDTLLGLDPMSDLPRTDFWANPGNFRDMGLAEASAVYDVICRRGGRERPR